MTNNNKKGVLKNSEMSSYHTQYRFKPFYIVNHACRKALTVIQEREICGKQIKMKFSFFMHNIMISCVEECATIQFKGKGWTL